MAGLSPDVSAIDWPTGANWCRYAYTECEALDYVDVMRQDAEASLQPGGGRTCTFDVEAFSAGLQEG